MSVVYSWSTMNIVNGRRCLSIWDISKNDSFHYYHIVTTLFQTVKLEGGPLFHSSYKYDYEIMYLTENLFHIKLITYIEI